MWEPIIVWGNRFSQRSYRGWDPILHSPAAFTAVHFLRSAWHKDFKIYKFSSHRICTPKSYTHALQVTKSINTLKVQRIVL
jgi:hypothetical protein